MDSSVDLPPKYVDTFVEINNISTANDNCESKAAQVHLQGLNIGSATGIKIVKVDTEQKYGRLSNLWVLYNIYM